MLNAEQKEDEATPRLLKRDVPVAPEQEGTVLVSQGGQKTKPAYWKVRDDIFVDAF